MHVHELHCLHVCYRIDNHRQATAQEQTILAQRIESKKRRGATTQESQIVDYIFDIQWILHAAGPFITWEKLAAVSRELVL